jgi:hypothetical protein
MPVPCLRAFTRNQSLTPSAVPAANDRTWPEGRARRHARARPGDFWASQAGHSTWRRQQHQPSPRHELPRQRTSRRRCFRRRLSRTQAGSLQCVAIPLSQLATSLPAAPSPAPELELTVLLLLLASAPPADPDSDRRPRDAPPPPESQGEKLRKQILAVGDGIVRLCRSGLSVERLGNH